jgi:hypothetical protein
MSHMPFSHPFCSGLILISSAVSQKQSCPCASHGGVWGLEIYLHLFLISALHAGSWVGSGAILDALEKRKISCPAKNRTMIPRLSNPYCNQYTNSLPRVLQVRPRTDSLIVSEELIKFSMCYSGWSPKTPTGKTAYGSSSYWTVTPPHMSPIFTAADPKCKSPIVAFLSCYLSLQQPSYTGHSVTISLDSQTTYKRVTAYSLRHMFHEWKCQIWVKPKLP